MRGRMERLQWKLRPRATTIHPHHLQPWLFGARPFVVSERHPAACADCFRPGIRNLSIQVVWLEVHRVKISSRSASARVPSGPWAPGEPWRVGPTSLLTGNELVSGLPLGHFSWHSR